MVAEIYLTEGGGARRLLSVMASGALTSFALVWIMQSLVHVDLELVPPTPSFTIEFVRVILDTPPTETPRAKPIRKPLLPPPIPPVFDPTSGIDPNAGIIEMMQPFEPILEPFGKGGSNTAGGGDRNAVPLVRVEPNYPPRALQQGIEGYVDLRFTITTVGTTSEIEVTNSEPQYIFDREAIRAVRRWRYKPSVADGRSVAHPSQSVRLEFELPQQGRR